MMALGLVAMAVGVVYLCVACQSLPGFMGPVHGDTSPRTGRGIVFVMVGLIALVGELTVRRRSRA
jgi:amino acid permease